MSAALNEAVKAIDLLTSTNPELAVMAATARGLMAGYEQKWGSSPWSTIEVEEQYTLPIINPDTGRPSRTFDQGGKADALAEFGGNNFLVEHKTAGETIDVPDSPYWRRLEIDAQVSAYTLAVWQRGFKVYGILYDVIRKPEIRPKTITSKVSQQIALSHSYCGFATDELPIPDSIETAGLYERRLIADISTRPDWYFQRKTIYRNDSQLLEYARELWATADEVRSARVESRHYRNSNACMNWGRPCEFLGICSGHDTPDSAKWIKRPQVHDELNLPSDGRDILTHSRLSTFRTCRRKHYYRYELGIKRADREEAESLFFGSIFHAALAAWWLAKRKDHSHEPSECSSEASEATEHTRQALKLVGCDDESKESTEPSPPARGARYW